MPNIFLFRIRKDECEFSPSLKIEKPNIFRYLRKGYLNILLKQSIRNTNDNIQKKKKERIVLIDKNL